MFRKSPEVIEIDIFKNPRYLLGKRGQKIYDNPKAWHQQFYRQLTSLVDESVFSPMYNEKKWGAPNREVRILVAMIALKEGVGCSDEQLFERCTFDILFRYAIGLFELDVECPCAATYYNFRKAILEYEQEHKENLYEKCFKQITKKQIVRYNINGKSIRMDSKQIGSNIAWYGRYQIVHETFRKEFNKEEFCRISDQLVREKALELYDEDAAKTIYRTTAEELDKRMLTLGVIIHTLLKTFPDKNLLARVFDEQFAVDEQGNVSIRPKEQISAKSVQNPNDPEATFRQKAGKSNKGYTTNITETHDQDGVPNVITSVQVEDATTADNTMVQKGIENTQEVTGQQVETLHTDGAYQSEENREFAENNNIDFVATGLQGKESMYDFKIIENDELQIVNRKTGERVEAYKTKSGWRFKIITKKGKICWRYIKREAIERMNKLRQRLADIPLEMRKKRNNVEATIFQYCFHTRNNKTRYRGLFKHQLQALARCLWINMRRIMIFELA